jgi:hypothetical protein
MTYPGSAIPAENLMEQKLKKSQGMIDLMLVQIVAFALFLILSLFWLSVYKILLDRLVIGTFLLSVNTFLFIKWLRTYTRLRKNHKILQAKHHDAIIDREILNIPGNDLLVFRND